MLRPAPLQFALHQMQLCDEKLAEIPIMVLLQYGRELAGTHYVLCPCQSQMRMKGALLRGETERGEGSHQTLMEAS